MFLLDICPLFKGYCNCEIQKIINGVNYKINYYSKGQIIANEGDICNSIGIVLKGSTEVQKIFASGKTITVSRLNIGEIFGEVVIFSKVNFYPSTIVSSDTSQIMFISKDDIIKMCISDKIILKNFMEILSNKILTLDKKLENISYQTLRQKIGSMILDEYKKQKNLKIKTPYSRKEMAEQLGVPRPSLSRELLNMKSEGLIDFDRNYITILDMDRFEDIFF